MYERVMKLALERGFYFPSCEVYSDSPAGFWEYGPRGVTIKNKFLELWRRELVRRDGMLEIDGSQIMAKSVFEASGHLSSFADPITRCGKCGATHRADRLIHDVCGIQIPESAEAETMDAAMLENNVRCPGCKGALQKVERFNMMFRVGIGPQSEDAYLRPETCQSIFVDFPRIYKTMRGRLPMGIAQVGKSFRNEIAPRQSLLRLREFYQAEIEIFCNPDRLDDDTPEFYNIRDTEIRLDVDDYMTVTTCGRAIEEGMLPNRFISYYIGILQEFYQKTGIDMERARFRRLGEKEKAFYADIAFDFEVETAAGWLELVACNYRTDHDLSGHAKHSGEKFHVIDGNDKVLPHVFEISMGIDRSIYTMLDHRLIHDDTNDRTVLTVKPYLAPTQVGILSLVKKDGLKEKTDAIYADINRRFDAFLDHGGAIGRRYRRLDEIGCPLAITIDHQTLVDDTVTIRERDSMEQRRIKLSDMESAISDIVSFP